MIQKNLQQLGSYIAGVMLTTRAKKLIFGCYIAFAFLEIFFIQSIQTGLGIVNLPVHLRQILLLLFFLISIVTCFALELWYITTREYQFLCTLDISISLRIFSWLSRPLYMVAIFFCLAIALSFKTGIHLFCSCFFSCFLILVLSSFFSHTYLRIRKLLRMVSGGIYKSTAVSVAELFCFGVIVHLVLIYENITWFDWITEPNIFYISVGLLWLFLLSRNHEPYEIITPKSKRSRNVEYSRKIPVQMVENLLMKDLILLKSNLSYVLITVLVIISSAYVRFMLSSSLLLFFIASGSAFILSTLSEEIIKVDMKMLPTLYTFPLSLKKYYSMSILAAAVAFAIPSLIPNLLLFTCVGADFNIVLFVSSLLCSFVISLLMCALQYTIVCDGFLENYSTQLILLTSIILSLFFPPYILLILMLRYKRVQTKFSGGRG